MLEKPLARTRPEHRAAVQASLREMAAEFTEMMATRKTTLGPPSIDFDDLELNALVRDLWTPPLPADPRKKQ